MYVYIRSEPGLWTVGYYHPVSGQWEPESDHLSRELAAARVHYLNGGRQWSEDVRLKKPVTLVDLTAKQ